jgi:transcriptional regulator with XRE-family HTH domain
MSKKVTLFGYDDLMDDLMVSASQLSIYLGVSRAALSQFSSGSRKPGLNVLVPLASISSTMLPHLVNPKDLAETIALKQLFAEEMESEIMDATSGLRYQLDKSKRDLKSAEGKYKHAIRAFNNLNFLHHNLTKIKPNQRLWIERQIQYCENVIIENSLMKQTRLKAKIAGLQSEINVFQSVSTTSEK